MRYIAHQKSDNLVQTATAIVLELPPICGKKPTDCVRFTGSHSVLNLDESQKYAHYLPRTSNS
jgi:hypothetical protein